MPRIIGWFNLGSTRNSTATRVVPGANYTKIMAIYEEKTQDLSVTLTCKGVAHRQSLELVASCLS